MEGFGLKFVSKFGSVLMQIKKELKVANPTVTEKILFLAAMVGVVMGWLLSVFLALHVIMYK